MSDAAERIFSACCPDSTVDVFEHAARVCEVVSAAQLAAFRRLPWKEPDQTLLAVEEPS